MPAGSWLMNLGFAAGTAAAGVVGVSSVQFIWEPKRLRIRWSPDGNGEAVGYVNIYGTLLRYSLSYSGAGTGSSTMSLKDNMGFDLLRGLIATKDPTTGPYDEAITQDISTRGERPVVATGEEYTFEITAGDADSPGCLDIYYEPNLEARFHDRYSS